MDQNDINIAMVTGNVSPLARFLLEAFERNGVFCSKSKKCNNFGLYRLRCTRLFSFCFWFLYKTRYVFKFVCFLFLTKCARKDNIILFTKATRNRIFNVAEYMRKHSRSPSLRSLGWKRRLWDNPLPEARNPG